MDLREVATLAVAAADIKTVADQPFVVVPEGYKVHDLEDFLPAPRCKVGTINLHDALSFVAYVNLHKSAATRVFADLANTRFLAVLDHHQEGIGAAGWAAHKALYTCPKSPEWLAWTGANKRPMGQTEFAQFLEDNLPDIIDPAGADILTVAQNLEAKTTVKFGSAVRLDNGQRQFAYEESVDGSAARGTMKVPEAFTIAVPPFVGSDRYKLLARLRYRIKDGQLVLWYDLHRPEKVVEAVFRDELARISTGWPAPADQAQDTAPQGIGLPILMGWPS